MNARECSDLVYTWVALRNMCNPKVDSAYIKIIFMNCSDSRDENLSNGHNYEQWI
jgi:hypothetical protein